MIAEELKVVVDKLNGQGKMSFLEAATEEQISQFEESNKIKLPESSFYLPVFNFMAWHISL